MVEKIKTSPTAVNLYDKQNCALILNLKTEMKELKHEIYRKLKFLKTEGAEGFPYIWKCWKYQKYIEIYENFKK